MSLINNDYVVNGTTKIQNVGRNLSRVGTQRTVWQESNLPLCGVDGLFSLIVLAGKNRTD
ncbi:MAG: hypothetical protein F4W92_04325 [Gammaproteobacteria bacterium]|nr:hypothetical protein [Gammaproteobacteria bacterium]